MLTYFFPPFCIKFIKWSIFQYLQLLNVCSFITKDSFAKGFTPSGEPQKQNSSVGSKLYGNEYGLLLFFANWMPSGMLTSCDKPGLCSLEMRTKAVPPRNVRCHMS